jgi:hypothetical protein
MEAGALFLSGALDAFANGGGRLLGSGARDIAVFDGRDFDVEIDAVQERAGNALAITVDLGRAATAFAFQIAEIAAWIWIPIWALRVRNLGRPAGPRRSSRSPYWRRLI